MINFKKYWLVLILLITIVFPAKTFSQHAVKKGRADFIIRSASKTPWAGGPAGYHGVKYNVELSTIYNFSLIHPDTIWAGEKCFPLVYKDSLNEQSQAFNISYQKVKGRTIFKIYVEERYIENRFNSEPEAKKEDNLSLSSRSYKGDMLLSYLKKGKRKYFILKAIKQNPMLAYP